MAAMYMKRLKHTVVLCHQKQPIFVIFQCWYFRIQISYLSVCFQVNGYFYFFIGCFITERVYEFRFADDIPPLSIILVFILVFISLI